MAGRGGGRLSLSPIGKTPVTSDSSSRLRRLSIRGSLGPAVCFRRTCVRCTGYPRCSPHLWRTLCCPFVSTSPNVPHSSGGSDTLSIFSPCIAHGEDAAGETIRRAPPPCHSSGSDTAELSTYGYRHQFVVARSSPMVLSCHTDTSMRLEELELGRCFKWNASSDFPCERLLRQDICSKYCSVLAPSSLGIG